MTTGRKTISKKELKRIYGDGKSEFCYPLSYYIEHGYDLSDLKPMKRMFNSQFFFCRHFRTMGNKGNCGKWCEAYKPRNGKSGCCKHNRYVYDTI